MAAGPSHYGGVTVSEISYLGCFERDLKKIQKKDPQLYSDVAQAIRDLKADPRPNYLRFEKLKGHDGIYTVHVRGNVKISMTLDGGHATLRRVANHDTIDSSP